MIWLPVTPETVLEHLPTDVRSHYDEWVVAYEHKQERLEDITSRTIQEFRNAIASAPANSLHPDSTYLPESTIRHCENIITFSLAMEIGIELSTAANSSRTASDVFLRSIPMGRWKSTTDEAGASSPRWIVPDNNSRGRSLP